MKNNNPTILIENQIYIVRGEKVMFDYDLAVLYGVPTKALNQAVKRNLARFPEDFMFQLSKEEDVLMRSQIVTASEGVRNKRNIKHAPLAFTEQGIAMLSGVLNSERAIKVNIQIMRTFTRLRQILSSYKDLKEKIEKLEKKYDGKFRLIFQTIQEIIVGEEKPKEKMGFRTGD